MLVPVIILIVFSILCTINIISVKRFNKLGERFTKPMLMPVLILLYIVSVNSPEWLIAFALVCGFLGDVFLMIGKRFFIPGLFSFLIGHIFYIIEFIKTLIMPKILISYFIPLIPYTIIGIFVYKGLSIYITSIKPHVILYLSAILLMSFTCLLRIFTLEDSNVWLTFLGSIFFIISDSILAYSIFKPNFKQKGAIVMFTYITAQALIVSSFIFS